MITESFDDLGKGDIDKAVSSMILSASGWRTVFAARGNEEEEEEEEEKKEENKASSISPAHKAIAAAAAKVFTDYVKRASGSETPVVVVGMDTRPTGKAIADAMIRAFLSEGCRVRFAAVTAAPEIMAYARGGGRGAAGERGDFLGVTRDSGGVGSSGDCGGGKPDGFVYISASHNPIGHNGLKFGLTDGGVLSGAEAKPLIEAFRAFLAAPDCVDRIAALLNNAPSEAVSAVYGDSPAVKAGAVAAYLAFTKEVVSGSGDKPGQERFLQALKDNIKKYPIGIAADFNGSARTLSIDKELLPNLGVKFSFINGEAGSIAHRIVPEGESLIPCAELLEGLHKKDPSVIMGYVPDCDGDRGNLVIWDEGQGRARPLEAQEVFALACVSELAHLVWAGEAGGGGAKGGAAGSAGGVPSGGLVADSAASAGKFAAGKVAIAVNDPTSLRIDRIAEVFGAEVFRAEVGEANVVGLARRLREQGYTVRILGEGSAGGNITHPSAVRDPIDTVFAMLKLLTIRSENGRKGFFELWCDLCGKRALYKSDFSFADIIATLPEFVSTSSYSDDALLHVQTLDHALLKERYQAVFAREWEANKARLKAEYGITGYDAACYIGLDERPAVHFRDAGKGGLKICFRQSCCGQDRCADEAGERIASIWMRGSGTEPVFRVMADAQTERLERELIAWQRKMVVEADGVKE